MIQDLLSKGVSVKINGAYEISMGWVKQQKEFLGRIEDNYQEKSISLVKLESGKTTIQKNQVIFECAKCHKKITGPMTSFSYWIYHKPLLIPRLLIFNINLCIRGGDHYKGGSVDVNSLLLKRFEPQFKQPLTLITPIVKDEKGNKLSKSYKNTVDAPAKKIICLARKCKTDSLTLKKS
jgi:hypothetical protein